MRGLESGTIIGCIINHVPDPQKLPLQPFETLSRRKAGCWSAAASTYRSHPANPELTACRAIDIARHLGGEVLHEGEIQTRRVKKFRCWRAPFPICSIPFRQGRSW